MAQKTEPIFTEGKFMRIVHIIIRKMDHSKEMSQTHYRSQRADNSMIEQAKNENRIFAKIITLSILVNAVL